MSGRYSSACLAYPFLLNLNKIIKKERKETETQEKRKKKLFKRRRRKNNVQVWKTWHCQWLSHFSFDFSSDFSSSFLLFSFFIIKALCDTSQCCENNFTWHSFFSLLSFFLFTFMPVFSFCFGFFFILLKIIFQSQKFLVKKLC